MENITINKDKLLAVYRTANDIQKEFLEKLYGKDIFSDWREITSYEKACEALGIQARKFREVGDRQQYMRMANAMQKLLVICEAINGDGGWYDKSGLGYYPAFVLYSNQEMGKLGEGECKRKCIHHLLDACSAGNSVAAGVSYVGTVARGAGTIAYFGFPLCLNSEEKAEFVGKQFFELCCTCYGVTPKMNDEK